jgi:nitroreductase
MDALTALKTRTSSPRLTSPGPTPQQMQVLYQSAVRAADHALLQPWRFIAIEGDSRDRLGDLFVKASLVTNPDMSDAEQDRLSAKALRAPLVLVVVASVTEHPKVPAIEQKLSAAAATQNILLAAFAQNLGAVWRTGELAYSTTVKEGLGLSPQEDIIGFIYLGTPAAPPRIAPDVDISTFISEW